MKVTVDGAEIMEIAQWFGAHLKEADIKDRPSESYEFRKMRDKCLTMLQLKEPEAKPENSITETEAFVMDGLAERGFAVAVFTADELGGCEPTKVEEHMIGAGWDAING